MKRITRLFIIGIFSLVIAILFVGENGPELIRVGSAQVAPTPSPSPIVVAFDQAAAVARLKEQIKGRENEPAPVVFKNIQTPFIKSIPAGRLLAVMEIAYSRSLGITCTHCHTPEKWESDEKPQKQIARDMAAMMAKINSPDLLRGIKNLKSDTPTINCTTCHRGETKPALNLAAS